MYYCGCCGDLCSLVRDVVQCKEEIGEQDYIVRIWVSDCHRSESIYLDSELEIPCIKFPKW